MNKQIDAIELKKYIDALLKEMGSSNLPFDRGAKRALRMVRECIVEMQKVKS